MTMSQMIKLVKKTTDWDALLVPDLGEVFVDQKTNKIKIGDGKTVLSNLPYIDSFANNPPKMTLSEQAKEFIENNIKYLEVDDYETFYSRIPTVDLAREVSKALFKAGLNPKEHLKSCPRGCESVFYYEGNYDPNAEVMETLKQKKWFNSSTSGKSWTLWDQQLMYANDYITGYDTTAKETSTLKELEEYLKPMWTLEEDE